MARPIIIQTIDEYNAEHEPPRAPRTLPRWARELIESPEAQAQLRATLAAAEGIVAVAPGPHESPDLPQS